jgi:Ca2+-binding EF-hand superfamily protein/diadenosine tetraphosphatase ApaH/serine/threonine PP2A family protein phosphatase
MKRNSPTELPDLDRPSFYSEFVSPHKHPKMAEAVETQKKTTWEQTWHALDFDDEKATIEQSSTVEALKAVTSKVGHKKRDAMHQKVEQLMNTKEFPSVEDSTYTGFHLPDPLTQEAVEGLMDAARRNKVLHPVYAMRLIVGAARIMKEQEQFMNEIQAPENGSVVVVGDTHGQLTDLLTIFKRIGTPSEKRIFVFNGDFVDRGPHDVSLLFILLAWKCLMPKSVFLNRGNHEQRRMNERYSFEKHCRETYKSAVVYELIQLMFLSLPMATLINQKVLVLHGGLFPYDDVTLDELRQLPRGEIPKSSEDPPRADRLRQDMLWSDPREEEGWAASTRGAGILWGPDMTKKFVSKNDLALVIRSHEMVDEGYLYWHDNKVVTLFSASNYCGKNENRGAVAIFDHIGKTVTDVRDGINGTPYFQQYYAEVFLDEQETAASATDIRSQCQQETLQKLRERIFQARHKLSTEFAKYDSQNTGLVSETNWATAMHTALGLPIDYLTLRPYLALVEDAPASDEESSATAPSASAMEVDQPPRMIKYMKFLDRYKVKVDKTFWATWEQAVIEKICHKLLEHSSSLKKAFEAMDTNGNQIIEYDEFVAVLSRFDIGLSTEQIFDFMRSIDVNRDGHVDYEEFSNTFATQWKSTKDSAKNSEEIKWLKKQIQKIGDVISRQKPSLRTHFKSFDASGDGGLSYEEFSRALKDQLGLTYTEEESLKLARLVDTNNSKRISWKEFKTTFTKPATDPETILASVLGSVSDAIHRSKTALRTLFYQMDLDGSGKIDVEELRTGLEALNVLLSNPLTDEQIKILHQHIDKDKDGFISYEEFLDSFKVVDTTETPTQKDRPKHKHKKPKPERGTEAAASSS